MPVATPESASGLSEPETLTATTLSANVSLEPKRTCLPESVAETIVGLSSASGNATALEHKRIGAVISPGFRVRRRQVTVPRTVPHAASSLEVPTARGPYRRSRAPVYAVVLITAVLAAYYAYRDPPQLKSWLAAATPTQGPQITTKSIITKSVAARSSDPPATVGEPRSDSSEHAVAMDASSGTEPEASAGSRATVSSVDVGDHGSRSETVVDNRAHVVAKGASSDAGVSKSDAAAKPMLEITTTTARTNRWRGLSSRATPTLSASIGTASRRQQGSDVDGDNGPPMPHVAVCTEAVAALGFCSLSLPMERD